MRVIGYIVQRKQTIDVYLCYLSVISWFFAHKTKSDPYLFIRKSEAEDYAEHYDAVVVPVYIQ